MSTHPHPLARRDINSHAEKFHHIVIPNNTGNPILDTHLYELSERFCGNHKPKHVLNLLSTAMGAAQSGELSKHEYKSLCVVLKELVEADQLFHPYDHIRKITCFGSARTASDHPNYLEAKKLGELATQHGYMTITGGGPGIMQAANEGAHADNSFGLNITLPFEQHPNPHVLNSGRLLNFYYFFTRKLNLVKQSDALVACPGGFGTMDEIYESITLMQTGKAAIFPIVLLDAPGEEYWERWLAFNKDCILADDLISPDDMDFIYHCQSAEKAIYYIEQFYHSFHSYYFDGSTLNIRLNHCLSEDKLRRLKEEFEGTESFLSIAQKEQAEKETQPELAHLARLVIQFKHGDYAKLRLFIKAINEA